MKSISIDKDLATSMPLDLETCKRDLRISGDSMDSLLTGQYIPAAAAWFEAFTKRSLISRAHRWIFDAFPIAPAVVYLPCGIVSAITSIAYSSGGSITTLTGPTSGSPAGADFQEDLTGHVARVMPNRGESWPTVDCDVLQPVKITYTAGWTTAELIPTDIKRALIMQVYGAMELDGLLTIRPGFDIDHAEKYASPWRSAIA